MATHVPIVHNLLNGRIRFLQSNVVVPSGDLFPLVHAGTPGIGFIIASFTDGTLMEWGMWSHDSASAVTVIQGSTHFAGTDTSTSLCVYNTGFGYPIGKNYLGYDAVITAFVITPAVTSVL